LDLSLSPNYAKIIYINKKKEGCLMATKLYTIENLLVGKSYKSRSRNFEGVITHAEKREAIWYGENTEAYLITVRTPSSIRDKYATIAVKVGE
jgi:hypothetical protein